MKIGDIVFITKGPPDKIGLIGEITNLLGNGAMVKLDKNHFTPIQLIHLEKLYKCFQCQELKRDYEMSPESQDIVNNNDVKLNQNICKECEEKLQKEAKEYVKNIKKGE